jgi:hypothetical protein
LKPIFFKLPQKVVTEYKCTVFAEDLFGRIRKHSKNNIRLMSPRSKELFSKLPTEIKMIMGDELDEEGWNKIRETGIIPLYLQDIEIQAELGRMTRGNVPKDTHMVQNGDNAPSEKNDENPDPNPDPLDDDTDELDELLSDVTYKNIQDLHKRGLLTEPNVTLKDIPRLIKNYEGMDNNLRTDPDTFDADLSAPIGEFIDDAVPKVRNGGGVRLEGAPRRTVEDPGGVSQDNILPSRLRRKVRFNLPKVNT